MAITAETHSDDYRVEVPFDAEPWFAQASDAAIVALAACGWGGDFPADAVAQGMSDVDPEVAALFDYLESVNAHRGPDTDPCGFECHVHDDAALAWLKTMRPALYATLTAAKTVGAEA